MIAVSEGTESIGDRGYNCLVTSTPQNPKLFSSYADHPRVVMEVRPGLHSSAAGRYQILAGMYDAYKSIIPLPDFSPNSQDIIAIQMIRECGALADISNGNAEAAIGKCSSRWASLPGAGYGQHENTLAALMAAFTSAGGRPA